MAVAVFKNFRFHFDARLAVLAAVAFSILIGLGVWQVQRLEWKRGLLAEVEAQAALPPQPLPEDVDPGQWAFRRASVTGVFLHDREIVLRPRLRDGQAGVELVTPLRRVSGGVILINRGWLRDVDLGKAERPLGTVAVSGLVRGGFKKGFFTPANDPDKGQWFWEDIGAMTTGLDSVLPVILYAAEGDGKILKGGGGVPQLANNHLSYAVFWFTMALVLIVIYILFSVRRTGA